MRKKRGSGVEGECSGGGFGGKGEWSWRKVSGGGMKG